MNVTFEEFKKMIEAAPGYVKPLRWLQHPRRRQVLIGNLIRTRIVEMNSYQWKKYIAYWKQKAAR